MHQLKKREVNDHAFSGDKIVSELFGMSLVIFWMYLELVKSCKIFLENSTKNFLICRLVCFSLNVSNMEEENNEWLAQYYSPNMWNKWMDPGEVVD